MPLVDQNHRTQLLTLRLLALHLDHVSPLGGPPPSTGHRIAEAMTGIKGDRARAGLGGDVDVRGSVRRWHRERHGSARDPRAGLLARASSCRDGPGADRRPRGCEPPCVGPARAALLADADCDRASCGVVERCRTASDARSASEAERGGGRRRRREGDCGHPEGCGFDCATRKDMRGGTSGRDCPRGCGVLRGAMAGDVQVVVSDHVHACQVVPAFAHMDIF
jgi:hypothetical protein